MKLPQPLLTADGVQSPTSDQLLAVAACDEFLIAGGLIRGAEGMLAQNSDATNVQDYIFRMDLGTHARRWLKFIEPTFDGLKIDALALSQDSSKVAVHGAYYEYTWEVLDGSPYGYLFVVNTADGGYETQIKRFKKTIPVIEAN